MPPSCESSRRKIQLLFLRMSVNLEAFLTSIVTEARPAADSAGIIEVEATPFRRRNHVTAESHTLIARGEYRRLAVCPQGKR